VLVNPQLRAVRQRMKDSGNTSSSPAPSSQPFYRHGGHRSILDAVRSAGAASLSIGCRRQCPSLVRYRQLGRDRVSMVMLGARTLRGRGGACRWSLARFAGVPLGLFAAARRGAIYELVMRGQRLIFAFPALLLAILMTAVFGPGAVNAIIAIGISTYRCFARVTLRRPLQLWTRDYALAARVAGKGPL